MFRSILVPLDGSELSEMALPIAIDLAKLSGARITLLTVVLGYPEAHVRQVPKLDEQTRQRALAYLQKHVVNARDAGLEVEGKVAHGVPSQEILGFAKARGAELIVMGTHGIGNSGLHALGSVAMKVLEAATCPVMMVRPKA